MTDDKDTEWAENAIKRTVVKEKREVTGPDTARVNADGGVVKRDAGGKFVLGTVPDNASGVIRRLTNSQLRKDLEGYGGVSLDVIVDIATGTIEATPRVRLQAAEFIINKIVATPKHRELDDDPEESNTLNLGARIDPDTGTLVFPSHEMERVIGPAPWEEKDKGD